MVPGQASPAQVVGTHKTVQGADVTVTGMGSNLKVNDASVVCGGVSTANAQVYMIDTVLMPPDELDSATTRIRRRGPTEPLRSGRCRWVDACFDFPHAVIAHREHDDGEQPPFGEGKQYRLANGSTDQGRAVPEVAKQVAAHGSGPWLTCGGGAPSPSTVPTPHTAGSSTAVSPSRSPLAHAVMNLSVTS